jgi:hypothetical protein
MQAGPLQRIMRLGSGWQGGGRQGNQAGQQEGAEHWLHHNYPEVQDGDKSPCAGK